jgi:2-polyprenyl-6-methoxyphenol hydroxylase-like FAD-dependent oxidoreductase
MQHADALIAGAGPAGAHLALRLARAGFSVLLLDQKRFPREKPCGEFLSPECLPMLEDLGLRTLVERAGARPLLGMDLWGYGRHARGSFVQVGRAGVPYGRGCALRREVLDALTVAAAGRAPEITVLEGHRVVGLLRDRDGAVRGVRARDPGGGLHELTATWTVGADGLHSRVADQVGVLRSVPWLQKFAFVLRYAGEFPQRHAEVHFLPGRYFAAAPVDDRRFTVNFVADRAVLPAGRSRVEAWIAQALDEAPLLRDKLRLATREPGFLAVGPLAGSTTRQIGDGWALVGDACGYVDPVTGEGLFFAMRGAEVLAEALVGALHERRTDARALAGYASARRREFAPRLWFARLLQRGLRSPWVTRKVLDWLGSRAGLADLLVSITGDYVPARELCRPAVWWRALRQTAVAS